MLKKLLLIVILFLIAGFLVIAYNYKGIRTGIFFLSQLFFNKAIELEENNNNINILLLGIGGARHIGSDLTDTIGFINIRPSENMVNFISIPRDIWIPDLRAKINASYSAGEENNGKGIAMAEETVTKVTGQTINYTLVVDFTGFEKIIDLLGGIDVDVKNTFDDYEYPIEGKEGDPCGHTEEELLVFATFSSPIEAFPCRYEHIHFDKGIQHMDGATSLKYVRSRHAKGSEGTDFARAVRQNQVILAVKNKVLSLNTLSNPSRVLGMYNVVKEHIKTDIPSDKFDDFIRLSDKMQNVKISHYVIDNDNTSENKRPGLLVNPPISLEYRYQWVLIPRMGNGNFSEIHSYVDCILQGKICEIKENGIGVFERQ